MNLAALAGLIDRASRDAGFAADLTLAFEAMKSGDLLKILKYDVEPALRLASILDPDPKVALSVTVAIFGIEVFIAAKQSGMLDELIAHLPALPHIDLQGADPQSPAMLRASGPDNAQI